MKTQDRPYSNSKLMGIHLALNISVRLAQLSGGLHAHLPQKDIEKKGNSVEQSHDAKKKKLIASILYLY